MQTNRIRTVGYWTCTLLVAFENAAGSMWVFAPHIPGIKQLHASFAFSEYLGAMLAHLGYPPYFKFLLGHGNSRAPRLCFRLAFHV